MSNAFNPLITQGLLNRIATHVVVANNAALTVTAPYMGKSQAHVTFEGPFTNQIGTAVGIVNSPEPYVMGQIVIALLRSQSLSATWISTVQTGSVIGMVTAFSDAPTTFGSIQLNNCSITEIDPGAFDGADPVVSVTVRGIFYVNQQLWAAS